MKNVGISKNYKLSFANLDPRETTKQLVCGYTKRKFCTSKCRPSNQMEKDKPGTYLLYMTL